MQTIPIKKNNKYCDYLILLIVLIGLYCLGIIVLLICIGIMCHIENMPIDTCYQSVNYWLLIIISPIIGISIYIIYLCLHDICKKTTII